MCVFVKGYDVLLNREKWMNGFAPWKNCWVKEPTVGEKNRLKYLFFIKENCSVICYQNCCEIERVKKLTIKK